jgi:hypothetical protein
MKTTTVLVIVMFWLMFCSATVSEADPMGTVWTYQGRLLEEGQPADGLYDFEFRLFDDPFTGTQQGGTNDVNDLDVINGYFTVLLDFGSDVFNGDARWLETTVMHADGSDPCTLRPRHEVTTIPYALQTRGMFVDGAGNVGIGTTSPGARLDVDAGGLPNWGRAFKLMNSGMADGTNMNFNMGKADAPGQTSEIIYYHAGDANGDNMLSMGFWGDKILNIKSNGGVGIGTEDPQERLHVSGRARFDLGTGNINVSTPGGWPGIIAFSQNGNRRDILYDNWGMAMTVSPSPSPPPSAYGIRIREDGRVGIGTASPAAKLDVNGQIKITDGTQGAGKVLTSDAGGLASWQTPTGGGLTLPYSGTTSSSGTAFSVSNTVGSIAVRGLATNTGASINYGGYFEAYGSQGRGVAGATSGVQGRGVYGLATSGSGSGIYGEATDTGEVQNYGGYFSASGTYGRGVYGEATSSWLYATNYGGYFLAHGPDSRGVYGKSTGWKGYGVYGDAAPSSPGTAYGVYGRSSGINGSAGVFGYSSDTDTTTYGVYGKAEGDSDYGVYGVNDSDGELPFRPKGVFGSAWGAYGVGVKGYGGDYGVEGDGQNYDFYASGPGTNYGAVSSIRWKNDVRPIDDPLAKVLSLRGVYFNWDAEHGGGHDVGMIAEEVGEVLPEIVGYEENGIDATGMDYSKLTPLLVEAVKALKKESDERQIELARKEVEITELKQRLSTLEACMAELTIAMEGQLSGIR